MRSVMWKEKSPSLKLTVSFYTRLRGVGGRASTPRARPIKTWSTIDFCRTVWILCKCEIAKMASCPMWIELWDLGWPQTPHDEAWKDVEKGALFQKIYTQHARIGSPLIPLIAIIGEISPSILAYLYLEQVKVWSRIWHQQQTHPFSIWWKIPTFHNSYDILLANFSNL